MRSNTIRFQSMSGGIVFMALFCATPVLADVVYDTGDPFGGPFGPIGFDVGNCQSVGVRFTPSATYTLDRIGVWFMNNDFSGATHPLINISLRTDDSSTPGVSIPSNQILESWTFNVSAVG